MVSIVKKIQITETPNKYEITAFCWDLKHKKVRKIKAVNAAGFQFALSIFPGDMIFSKTDENFIVEEFKVLKTHKEYLEEKESAQYEGSLFVA
jgi:hypothetical protein